MIMLKDRQYDRAVKTTVTAPDDENVVNVLELAEKAAWRTVAIEQYAERQLEQRKGEEIGRRQQPELGRAQGEIGHEIGRHHRIHRAQQIGQEIAASEGRKRHGHDSKGDAGRHVVNADWS